MHSSAGEMMRNLSTNSGNYFKSIPFINTFENIRLVKYWNEQLWNPTCRHKSKDRFHQCKSFVKCWPCSQHVKCCSYRRQSCPSPEAVWSAGMCSRFAGGIVEFLVASKPFIIFPGFVALWLYWQTKQSFVWKTMFLQKGIGFLFSQNHEYFTNCIWDQRIVDLLWILKSKLFSHQP